MNVGMQTEQSKLCRNKCPKTHTKFLFLGWTVNRTKLLTFKITSFMHLWMLRCFCYTGSRRPLSYFFSNLLAVISTRSSYVFFLFFLSNSEILNLVKLTWFPVWTKYRCCPCQMFWNIPHIQRHYPWSLCRLPCSRWIPVYLCRHLEKK